MTSSVGLTDLRFRLVREDFADAVAWVARSLPSRPTAPVLAGVLLAGTDNGLTISGFDYEVSAEVQIAAEIAWENQRGRLNQGLGIRPLNTAGGTVCLIPQPGIRSGANDSVA